VANMLVHDMYVGPAVPTFRVLKSCVVRDKEKMCNFLKVMLLYTETIRLMPWENCVCFHFHKDN
jgi:hypothetical protein